MLRKSLLTIFIALCFSHVKTAAQLVGKGHEIQKGTQNFSELAIYLHEHPEPQIKKAPENEEDNEFHFVPPAPDSTQVHRRVSLPSGSRFGSSAPSALLPVSPTPADTFESTLDNGTNIPPDTHGAVDATYCVTAINPKVHIQRRTGGSVSAVSLDAFWAPVLSGGGSFDPRVHYDMYANRWIIIAVSGGQSASSAILIAVSKTADPTGAWWQYKITADATGVNWLDFPCIGFNSKWITITGNLFAVSGGAYHGAKVFVFNKANLLSGAGASYTSFLQSSSFSIAPAVTYSATEPNLFCAENWNGSAGVMHVWKISGAVGSESMTSVGYPGSSLHWWYTSYPISGTSGADFAPQVGTTDKIQTNDDRVTQCVFMNNTLWFAHTVFLPYNPAANPTRASVQWWQTDTLANPLQNGTIDDPTSYNFYAFPSIAANTAGDAVIGFSAFSPSIHPSCAYALRSHSDPVDSTRPLMIFRHGQNTYYKTFGSGKNRWGDYSATNVDPTNLTDFWTIQEASAPTVNLWDTWWAHVTFCSAPAAITGNTPVCAGSSIVLSDGTAGGSWSSSNTSIATVSTTGLVTGVAAGTATIYYSLTSGCSASVVVTVNPTPVPILGPSALCIGSTVTLSDAVSGGYWYATGAVLTITSSGVVTGLSAGSEDVTYSQPTGCMATRTEVVNISMTPITGSTIACVGEPTTLGNVTTGGTWSSNNTAIATINPSTGVVTGITTGTTVITYATGSGCMATITITVDPIPLPITGATTVCKGLNTIFSDATPGGTWTSGNTGIATVSGTGDVTGLAAGTASISYTILSGCYAVKTISVSQSPAAISAPSHGCKGATFTLADAVAGGTWRSSNTAVASINPSSGAVTGISVGATTISYTLSNGCMAVVNLPIQVCTQGVGQVSPDSSAIIVTPNPNNGTFVISGSLETQSIESTVLIEVVDILGHVVYKGEAVTHSGKLDEQISMGHAIADGVYLVHLHTSQNDRVVRMVIASKN